MDPIHPIAPASVYPPAVERVHRVPRADEDRRADERRRPRRKTPPTVAADQGAAVVDGDGHFDARA